MATTEDKSKYAAWMLREYGVDPDNDLDPISLGDFVPKKRQVIKKWINEEGSRQLREACLDHSIHGIQSGAGSLKKKRRQYRSKKRSKKPSKKRSKKRTSRRRR